MNAPEQDPAFEAVLEFLKRSRGFDFTGYKRTSLERRFRHRMDAIKCDSYGDYLDYLEVHPEEYEQLFDTLLINVTEFYRDRQSWQHLQDDVLPDLSAAKASDEPMRIWCAGCATGQEAYTAAMVLAEVLGKDAFLERVKIYATDVDEEALSVARLATYTQKEAEGVSEELRAKYFERVDQRLAFRQGPAPQHHLRAQQPRVRRADLAAGSAHLPQHAHVLHGGDAGPCAAPLPLRAARPRPADARQVGDDDLAP